MTLDEFLKHADARLPLDTPDIYRFMDEMSDEARHITCEINNAYHSQAELRELFSRLTGRPVDETFKRSRHSIRISGKTSPLANTCSSTPVAISKTTEVSRWATVA